MVWLTVPGVALIVLTLHHVFRTLWHPRGRGVLSRWVMLLMWRASRTGPLRRVLRSSGPTGILLTVVLWTGLLVAGWSLVYLAHLPAGALYPDGVGPSGDPAWGDALYLSTVTLATLGYGDLAPVSTALRFAAPIQAVVGFALLTATVTWIMQVHPALTRRRGLALRVTALRASEGPLPASTLHELAGAVASVRLDLTQYVETYYFRDQEDATELALALPGLLRIADDAHQDQEPARRHAGATLRHAVEDLLAHIDRALLHTGTGPGATLDALAADRRATPTRPTSGRRP